MTHLVWRKGWAYFRFKLPDDLAGKPVPSAWPDDLNLLVNTARRMFKVEIWKSLKLAKKDEQRAKRAVATRIAETTSLIDEARLLLARGPAAGISDEDIAAIAARVHADRLAHDEQLRLQGIGLRLPRAADLLRIPSAGHRTAPATEEPGLTEDDLGLLRFAAEKVHKELQEAAVRMRPPAAVKQRVAEELAKRGAELAPDERRRIEIEVLKAELRASNDIRARLDGEIIPTPIVEPIVPTGGQDPMLKQAFALWKDGAGVRGGKLPSRNTAHEAEVAVRRFAELHGNLRVSSIKRGHVRSFRDAMIKLPKHLPHALQKLPLPRLLEQLPGGLAKRSARTVNKSLRLLSAITNAAANEYDFAERPGGWRNPFHRIAIIVDEGEDDRLPFTIADLKAVFASPVYAEARRPTGGRGEAAFWFPLISLYTGARLEEIAQLYVRDLQQVPNENIWFFNITDVGTGQRLKVGAKNRREVPVHAELVRLGLVAWRVKRQAEAGVDALLFPGFEPNRAEKRSGAWSKWFNRYLRNECGIGDTRKVFHSFRHTFKDACRNSDVAEDHHDQLTSHAARGRNAGRGYGVGLSLDTLNRSIQKVRYRGLDLSDLYPATKGQ
ncbi:site-specific integrase [Bradyrhizobium sp. URHA0013]|uniref:site-specific integrase n=1 Tax=Bradyrhizobium sp. URHA0013 TaxID=1380352 RepID=UPI000684CF9D|nr:site-specific integrase [Bradyrhizobium sp. URHA0013]